MEHTYKVTCDIFICAKNKEDALQKVESHFDPSPWTRRNKVFTKIFDDSVEKI